MNFGKGPIYSSVISNLAGRGAEPEAIRKLVELKADVNPRGERFKHSESVTVFFPDDRSEDGLFTRLIHEFLFERIQQTDAWLVRPHRAGVSPWNNVAMLFQGNPHGLETAQTLVDLKAGPLLRYHS